MKRASAKFRKILLEDCGQVVDHRGGRARRVGRRGSRVRAHAARDEIWSQQKRSPDISVEDSSRVENIDEFESGNGEPFWSHNYGVRGGQVGK